MDLHENMCDKLFKSEKMLNENIENNMTLKSEITSSKLKIDKLNTEIDHLNRSINSQTILQDKFILENKEILDIERNQKNNEIKMLEQLIAELKNEIIVLKEKFNISTIELNKNKDELLNVNKDLYVCNENYYNMKIEYENNMLMEREQIKL